ncbi:hypothetical protein PEC18_38095 [Paucibacter sp. O1-1]|nr:hypothetical protein [Paucibacter sp. O1-1]MDA3831438.1 hypothetical protein [Paucibacter sp. O1-1]
MSLKDIMAILTQLTSSNEALSQSVNDISAASEQQKTRAQSLLTVAKQVQQQASDMANSASQGSEHAKQQVHYLDEFVQAMDSLMHRAKDAFEQNETIAHEVSNSVGNIEQNLGIGETKSAILYAIKMGATLGTHFDSIRVKSWLTVQPLPLLRYSLQMIWVLQHSIMSPRRCR